MSTLENAIVLATNYHKNQWNEKSNEPYILHPLRIMLKCRSERTRIVAVLHDVVEDTEATLDTLRNEGFSNAVVEAVDCLSRRKNESYEDFIKRVRTNNLATMVKIYDIEDNMDVSRLINFTDKDKKRMEKYDRAREFLIGGITCLGELEP